MTASNNNKKLHRTVVKTMFRAMVRVGASPANIVKDTEFMRSWNAMYHGTRGRLLQRAPEEYQRAMNEGTLLAQRMWMTEGNSVAATLGDRDQMQRWYRLGRARQDELLRDAPEEWRAALNMDAIHQRVWRDDDVNFFRAVMVDQYTKNGTEEAFDETADLLEEMIASRSAPRFAIEHRDWPSLLLYLSSVAIDLKFGRRNHYYDLVNMMSVLDVEIAELEKSDISMHKFLLGAQKGYLNAVTSISHLPLKGNCCDPTESYEYTLFRDKIW